MHTSYRQTSNFVQTMHPPSSSSSSSSSTTMISNNNTIRLSHEHRTRLYQIINELSDEQIRLFLTNHLQSISNTTLNNQFQHHSRTQLIQQACILVDSNYSVDLEQTLYAIRQKRLQPDYQQQIHRSQQQQQNYNPLFNQQQQQQQQQQSYYYAPQPVSYNVQPNYRYPTTSNVSQQYRQIRPNTGPTQIHNQNNRVQQQQPQQQQQQQSSYLLPVVSRQQYIRQPSTLSLIQNNAPSTITRYQIPVLPPPPSSSSSNVPRPLVPSTTPTLKIIHKTLPFYQPLTCVYESYQVFRYDTYRKQNCSRNDFLLSLDICNQLALSYDYDPDLDIHKTNKCLIMRLVRTDQPAMSNGKYDDNLPPNLVVNINSQNLTNLPVPKPCTRQQTDLIRIGREIDITSYCMFNPSLNNELSMTWSYRQDNINLHIQYINAQYALHIFLVKHLSIEDLCEQIKNKTGKFYREDLVRLLAKAIATDRDLGLEVSDQKLKLKCPIDQRRLKTPVRAITCQHLQCFDLTNYITLNEKAGKWICPVCNKSALFDDLQIDSYTESIINSIENENITEISIDSHLNWSPVTSSLFPEQQQQQQQQNHQQQTVYIDDIILDDDDDNDPMNDEHKDIDTKLNIQLMSSAPMINQPADIILIDD